MDVAEYRLAPARPARNAFFCCLVDLEKSRLVILCCRASLAARLFVGSRGTLLDSLCGARDQGQSVLGFGPHIMIRSAMARAPIARIDTSTPVVVFRADTYCTLGIVRSLGRMGIRVFCVD